MTKLYLMTITTTQVTQTEDISRIHEAKVHQSQEIANIMALSQIVLWVGSIVICYLWSLLLNYNKTQEGQITKDSYLWMDIVAIKTLLHYTKVRENERERERERGNIKN